MPAPQKFQSWLKKVDIKLSKFGIMEAVCLLKNCHLRFFDIIPVKLQHWMIYFRSIRWGFVVKHWQVLHLSQKCRSYPVMRQAKVQNYLLLMGMLEKFNPLRKLVGQKSRSVIYFIIHRLVKNSLKLHGQN